ncbi:MAG: glycosyltransferase [Myxococcota bacterium]
MVTLVTTFHDAARFLPECLASARAQTDARWIHLLYDDGSTDESAAIAQAAADADPRVRLVSAPHRGRRAALQAAHALVDTEFVAWLDADDELHPTALERTLEVINSVPGCGLVFTDHTRMDAGGQKIPSPSRPAFTRPRMLLDFATFHFRLMRASALEAAGGIRDDYEIAIDYDLCLRLCEVTRVVHLAEPLYAYRRHRAQMSSQGHARQVEASRRAVHEAIGRANLQRSLAVAVDPVTKRFSAKVRAMPSGRRRQLAALGRMVARRPLRLRTPVETATVWPHDGRDPIKRALEDGLFQASVAHRPAPATLPGLVRHAFAGRLGELLVLGAVAPKLASRRPGASRALVQLLAAALDRARGQGVRVVWARWWDDDDARLEPEATNLIARRCDAIVAHPRDPLGCGPSAPTRVSTPPCHIVEHYPVVTRATARETLGLPAEARVIARLGDAAEQTDEAAARFASSRGELDHLLVQGSAPAVDAPGVHWIGRRSLPQVVAASDAVVIRPGAGAVVHRAIANARGRAIVASATVKDLDGGQRRQWRCEGTRNRLHALRVGPRDVAVQLLAAIEGGLVEPRDDAKR